MSSVQPGDGAGPWELGTDASTGLSEQDEGLQLPVCGGAPAVPLQLLLSQLRPASVESHQLTPVPSCFGFAAGWLCSLEGAKGIQSVAWLGET